jgi:hypothetical protein
MKSFFRIRIDIDDVKVAESKSSKISDLDETFKNFKKKMK